MNIGNARVVFRHRSTMDVLDLAARFLVHHRAPFLALSALVLLPSWVLSLIIVRNASFEAGAVAALGLAAVADLPFTVLASRLVFEERVPLTSVLGDALRALPRLVLARAVQAVAFVAGLSACGLPGIWLGVMMVFTCEVVALEKTPVFQIFTRCNRLVSGQFGDAFIAWFWLLAIQGLALVLVDYGGRHVLRDLLQVTPPSSMFDDPKSLLALTGVFLIVPYTAVARLLSYLNVRTRSEGWDIQARFVTIAQRLAGSGS